VGHRYERRPRPDGQGDGPGITVPDHLERSSHVWRLVNRDVAEYSDIVRHWDIMEVMTANEWLDIRDDIEYLQSLKDKAELEANRRRTR